MEKGHEWVTRQALTEMDSSSPNKRSNKDLSRDSGVTTSPGDLL